MASNPFRKSRPEDRILSLDTPPAPTPPPPVSFKTQPFHLSAPPAQLEVSRSRSESPLPPSAISTSESRQRRKSSGVVKKVRLLSPPQSPEDDAAWPFNVPMEMDAQQGQVQSKPQPQPQPQPQPPPRQLSSEEYAFPSVEDFERGRMSEQPEPSPQPAPPASSSSAPPPNPFNKTLHDLETTKQKEKSLHHQEELEGAALKAGNLAKGSLDVDAFRRLLMTGKSEGLSGTASTDGTASPVPSRKQIVEDLATPDGLSSDESEGERGGPFGARENGVVGRSGLGREITREDLDTDVPAPAPEDGDSGEESESSVSVQIGTRGKKPPPPPPSSRHGRSIISGRPSEDAEPPAERAPPAKLEADAAAPHAVPSAVTTSKKPVPAPPPRRGHARSDTAKSINLNSPGRTGDDDAPPRSSMESHTSATKTFPPPPPPTSSTKPAPAPPPPRRPTRSGSNPIAMAPSPALSPSAEGSSLHEPENEAAGKSAPPPPPARHGSTRRRPAAPAAAAPGADKDASGSAKHQKLGVPPPAPPPPRQRGSSKGSVDGVGARTVAIHHMQQHQHQQQEEEMHQGMGGDILADLEALQREVDAMRGKLG